VPGEEELKALSCHTDDAVREWCAVCGFDEECGKEGGVWQGLWQGGRSVARSVARREDCGKEGGDAAPPFSIQV